jgi:copper chaperone CopZ
METMIDVKGMHCKGCERTISNALMKTAGVNGAKVSYVDERAVVEFNEKDTNAKTIVSVIKEAGYDANVAEPKTARKRFLGLF